MMIILIYNYIIIINKDKKYKKKCKTIYILKNDKFNDIIN